LVDELASRTDLTDRACRLLRMAGTALVECLPEPLRKSVPLMLALPEHHAASPLDPRMFIDALAKQTGKRCDPATSRATFEGRAGGLAALAAAAEIIKQTPDALVLVGGVDSYRDAIILERLDKQGRIHTSRNADGFIPGEAAAFLLVGGLPASKTAGKAPLAALTMPATGMETGHLYSKEPYLGEGLASTVRQLLEKHGGMEPIRDVYGTMNSEHYWTREWGTTLTRNNTAFAPAHQFHHPVQNYGDTGAASAPLLLMLAALNIQKAANAHSPALVYASSDFGSRAAALVFSHN
jgi:3-oxoacyl-[acyl-carrier-protein] synthase-1